ncbi:MAG: hypothetical protein COV34_02695 [Candidatus Zambryskibacteria bacterium CG10_big_fil_rev_8_21_14_0_10_42_12]|uniref:Uncharacterized protein n=1 Tax=Candidatus Zambryskibacteria bacterium CG10_big_fil_rev_8_21_14_0_10_42_12 TaxID=1975115 RepID=A0A2H0QUL3_9BACT|nr:MAG: hypothetical protein COV34_02695 [Candidatus Zambryskibacteria bacterium CG10_big_fil_rev_8_21_14_0_10_42_12]
MEAVAKSDLFFMITSVVVVLVGALLLTALVYVVRVIRDVRKITHVVRDEAELIKEDIDDFRDATKEGSLKTIRGFNIARIIKGFFGRKKK